MIYEGIDYYKKYSQVEAMDKERKTLSRTKLLSDDAFPTFQNHVRQ